jgi:serine phosphatase RsbU (regulator of sigma subunit)/tetratricopeptide (TPR) repeat protein
MKTIITLLFSIAFTLATFNQANGQNQAKSIDELCNTAEQHCKEQKYEHALLAIRKILDTTNYSKSDSVKALANYTAGKVFFLSGIDKEAIHHLFKANEAYNKTNNTTGIQKTKLLLSDIYFSLAAYHKSIKYKQDAYKILGDTVNINNTHIDYLSHFAACNKALGEYSSAAYYYRQLLSYYLQANDTANWIGTLFQLTEILEQNKKYEEAIEYHTQLFKHYIKQQNNTRIIETLNNIAFNFVLIKEYKKAIAAFVNAEKRIKKDTFSIDFRTSLYTNLGICYQNTGEPNQAIIYLLKAYNLILNTSNFNKQAFTANIIALYYFHINELFNAVEYAEEAVAFAKKASSPALLSNCYKTAAMIMQAAEEPQKALNLYSSHLRIQDSILRAERIEKKSLQEKLDNLENNEKELKLKIAEENVKDILLEQLQLKAVQREQENEILRNQTELQASEKERIKQSLLLAEQQTEALQRQRELETLAREKELKENQLQLKEAQEKEQAKEIALLESEKEKQSLEIQKQELAIGKQAEKEKRMAWVISMAVLMIFLIMLFLISVKKRNKILKFQKKEIETKNEELNTKNEEINTQAEHLREANEELTVKNEEIYTQAEHLREANEELMVKNEEISAQRDDIEEKKSQIEHQSNQIISSIQYAKRIQQAILPENDTIKALMPDHFILFKPKDIVSGDFYWTKQLDHYIYATVADCTGHGVPGAFMSMLGTAFLNEITGQNTILTPGEILNELRQKVKKSLKQVGKLGETKDGMDMALVRIDLNNGKVQFAGAHNPLLIIRASNNPTEYELEQIKGDRMPIGINRKEDNFTNNEIQLYPNDSIYLYSDGYIDQFGGENGNKFMTGKFKRLLLEIGKKPMHEQMTILENTITKWRGNFDQIDDICVMGIRFQEVYGELEMFGNELIANTSN